MIDDLVDFADFLPTLAEAAKLPLPDGLELDGISFWPRLRGETGPVREWHYTYYFPRPFAQLFDNPYRHPEIGYVRDERFKLYSDGSLFDVRRDPREHAPLPMSDGPAGAIRRKLQAVLDAMPGRAARIPAEQSSASRGVPRPRWPEQ